MSTSWVITLDQQTVQNTPEHVIISTTISKQLFRAGYELICVTALDVPQQELALNMSTRRTRKAVFLDEMNLVVPWTAGGHLE